MTFSWLLVPLAYLVGSVSFAVLVSRWLNLPDPREAGSHNPGATNVLRLGGKKAAILTLLGDLAKGFLPLFAAYLFSTEAMLIAAVGLAAFLGHLYPVFFGFKGGKGVATALGSVLSVAPLIGLTLLLAWLGAVALWRYSSGGALTAFGLFPIIVALLHPSAAFISFAVVVTGLIVVKHKGNIERLWKGTESKVGQGRPG